MSDPADRTLTWAPAAATPSGVPVMGLDVERYLDRGHLARGGMGEIRRVYDTRLDCVVAMKILGSGLVDDPNARVLFINEGTITARLQHPGIVAVHDRGELEDRRLWYTMTEVRGQTFQALIDQPVANEVPLVTLRRRVGVLQKVCEAMAYAHEQSVVHRDLKPDNLMVGAFGEVLVMDWGIASAPDRDPDPEGSLMGTVKFMAPEQARGEIWAQGPWTDVYALGAILHILLAGHRPLEGENETVLACHRTHGVQPFLQGPLPEAPTELVAICRRCLTDRPEDRVQNAGLLSAALQAWLEGAEQRATATRTLQAAMALLPRIEALRAGAAEHRTRAEALFAQIGPYAGDDEKRPAWEAEDQARRDEREAIVLEADWTHQIGAALEQAPDLAPARRALADHYAAKLVQAEDNGLRDEAARCEVHLRRHDRGWHTALIEGAGSVTLQTDPPGATVRAHRYTAKDRRLTPVFRHELGQTPLNDLPIEPGSWLLELSAPGHVTVRYPVALRRGQPWNAVRPGETEPHRIRLPRVGELGPDDCYVPAGWFRLGGDALAPESLPARQLWVDGFSIQRFQVRNSDYCQFLNALVHQGHIERAAELAPIRPADIEGPPSDLHIANRRYVPRSPELAAWPVVLVGWDGARAYASWYAALTGKPWRLPHDLEWEKAARGTDGRVFPWGDHGEKGWANMSDSRPGPPGRVPVSEFPIDESPYGVRGLAGNVRDICLNGYTRTGPPEGEHMLKVEAPTTPPAHVMVRGGSWSSTPRMCRLAVRYADPPINRLTVVGFRLARPLS